MENFVRIAFFPSILRFFTSMSDNSYSQWCAKDYTQEQFYSPIIYHFHLQIRRYNEEKLETFLFPPLLNHPWLYRLLQPIWRNSCPDTEPVLISHHRSFDRSITEQIQLVHGPMGTGHWEWMSVCDNIDQRQVWRTACGGHIGQRSVSCSRFYHSR